MERVAVIASLICCISWHSATAYLTVTPHVTESKVNGSTYFNCSTNISKQIHWTHDTKYIYAGGLFVDPYLERFQIEINSSTGAYNLVITSVEARDAGEYSCQDDGGHGMTSSAKLIVLADEPTCETNSFEDGKSCGLSPDEVQLSCSVTYSGNIPPRLEWRKAGATSSVANSTIVDSGGDVTYSIRLKTDLSMNNQSYVCSTTRSVNSQFQCSSEPISLQYVFGGNAKVETTMDKEVKCSANSTQTCSYKWKWFSGSDLLTVATDQTLKPTRAGSHRCEATCDIGNRSCTVNVTFVEVVSPTEVPLTEMTTVEAATGQNLWFLWLLLVVALLILIIVLVLICWRRRRANKGSSIQGKGEAMKTDQSETPLLEKSPAEPNNYTKVEVDETKNSDESKTPSIALNHQQEKQIDAESKGKLDGDGEVKKTDPSKMPLMAVSSANDVEKSPAEKNNCTKVEVVETKNSDQSKTPSIALNHQQEKQIDAESERKLEGLIFLEGKPEVVSSIERDVGKGKTVTGVTVLKEKLLILTMNPSTIEAYDVKTLQQSRRAPITELGDLYDITSCQIIDSVFISGSDVKAGALVIVGIDPTTLTISKRWPTGDYFGNLSISAKSTIILCVSYANMLIEYTSEGEKIREIAMPELGHPIHAVKLASGQFVVSHGRKSDTLHRVCKINEDGAVIRSCGDEKGTPLEYLNGPNYLIVDEKEGAVLVLDSSNRRVLLLDINLNFKTEFVPKCSVLVLPSKTCICKKTRNLFVVHSKSEVLVFNIK